MSRTLLFPFPRLRSTAVAWSDWRLVVDGHEVSANEFADAWDANSSIEISRAVTLQKEETHRLRGGTPMLLLSVSCAETAFTAVAEEPFVATPTSLAASSSISFSGRNVSQKLTLRSQVIQSLVGHEGPVWTDRRIIADATPHEVGLDSELSGFPTTARSFAAAHLPDAPWEIKVTATDLSDSFSNTVRLYLNEDYPAIRELMDGRPKAQVEAELSASIARVLLQTSRRLWDAAPEGNNPDAVADEYPDSVAAAAQRAAKTYLRTTLTEAVDHVARRPETVEYKIASAAGILRGRT